MTIAVLGSINIDITAYAERLPRPGETLHGERYITGLGGKGANQAVAAAKLGAVTEFIGRVGSDHFGSTALDLLQGFEVEVAHVGRDAGRPTGIAIINVDSRGENFITVIPGANFSVAESDVDAAAAALRRADVLLLQLEIPWQPMMLAAKRARAAQAQVVLDPAPAPSRPDAIDLELVDIVTPNETEAEVLTGIRPSDAASAAEAARILHRRGPKTVVIKLGARGAYLSTGTEGIHVPPFEVETVDTVAAGDCFNGGLAFALAQNFAVADAVRFASACAALSTTRYGAAAAAPTRAEVELLLSRR